MPDQLALLLARTFSPRGMRIAIPLALLGVAAAGALFALIEGHSIGDGLWWAFVTVTTVGYGDVTPQTGAGKLLAVALMVGGIGFLLVLAGALVEHFVAVEVEEHEVLRRLDALSDQVEALSEQVRALDADEAHDDRPAAARSG